MGCDIHLITEIRKNGKWQYVEEVPTSLDCRNYATFSVLADVRNDFHHVGFQPKGLPDDLSSKCFMFVNEREHIEKSYEEGTERKIKLPDGSLIDTYDSRVKRQVNSREEADKYGGWSCSNGVYTVTDVSLVNGEYVDIPCKELYTKEEWYAKYEDEWEERAGEYGYYRIDFDCCDYHSHSWLTLKELLDYDLTDYLTAKIKVPKVFYDKFKEFGGVLPEGMTVLEEFPPNSIVEAVRMAFQPDVIISYVDDKNKNETPLVKGINELKEIAEKYSVLPEDIRIVFAFDN